MKFCSFGSRYAGMGWQLEKTFLTVHTTVTPSSTQMMGPLCSGLVLDAAHTMLHKGAKNSRKDTDKTLRQLLKT